MEKKKKKKKYAHRETQQDEQTKVELYQNKHLTTFNHENK